MKTPRPLSAAERAIAHRLVEFAGAEGLRVQSQIETALVVEMDDGGMGSLLFVSAKTRRIYGGELARCVGHDSDGMELNISLILDQDGDLFELDIWKVDFSPLAQHPDPSTLVRQDPM